MLTILMLTYLFIVANLALVGVFGYAVFLAIEDLPQLQGPITVLEGVLATTVLTATFIFLVKPYLLYEASALEGMVRLKESDAPEFFGFLRELCQESKLSFPTEIYLCYGSFLPYTLPLSPLSIFFPKRERLLIGIAAVKNLTLTEFQTTLTIALRAQGKVLGPLSSYYKVSRFFAVELLQYEDSLYRGFKEWRSSSLLLSLFLWPVTISLWVARSPLILIGSLLFYAYKSKVNAIDKEACLGNLRDLGHDGMLSAYWKAPRVEFGRQYASQVLTRLARERRFSDDISFHHQSCVDVFQSNAERFLRFDPRQGIFVEEYSRREGQQFSKREYQSYFDPREHSFFLALEAEADALDLPAAPTSEPAWTLFNDQSDLLKKCSRVFYEQLLKKPFSSPWTEAKAIQEDFERIFHEGTGFRHEPRYGGFFDRNLHLESLESLVRDVESNDGESRLAELRSALDSFLPSRCFELVAEMETLERQREWYENTTGPSALDLGELFFVGPNAVSRDAFLEQYDQASQTVDEQLKEADEALIRYLLAKAKEQGGFDELVDSLRFLSAVLALIEQFQTANWLRDIIPFFGPEVSLLTLKQDALMPLIQEAWADFESVLEKSKDLVFNSGEKKSQSVSESLRTKEAPVALRLQDIPEPFFTKSRPQLQHCWDELRKIQFESVARILSIVDRLDPSLFSEEAGAPTKKASEES